MSHLITLTPGNVGYLACSAKTHFLIEKKQFVGSKPSSPALWYGSAVHWVLAKLYAQVDPHDLSSLALYVRAAFSEQPYKNEDDRIHDMQRAIALVTRYMAEMDDDIKEIVGIERAGAFEVKYEGKPCFRAWARLDFMFRDRNQPRVCHIRDWRVGGMKALTCETIWLNLAVAKHIVSEPEGMPPAFDSYVLEVDALTDEGVERVSYPSSTMRGIVKLVCERVVAYHAEATHEPMPGEQCLYCDRRQVCLGTDNAVDAEDLDF